MDLQCSCQGLQFARHKVERSGALQLLGRADNVRDFVRRGEREGFVQIWLKTGKPAPGNEINIKRSLDAKENKSEWRINGTALFSSTASHSLNDLCIAFFIICTIASQSALAFRVNHVPTCKCTDVVFV